MGRKMLSILSLLAFAGVVQAEKPASKTVEKTPR